MASCNPAINMVLIPPPSAGPSAAGAKQFLRFALCSEPLASVMFAHLHTYQAHSRKIPKSLRLYDRLSCTTTARRHRHDHLGKNICAIPQCWPVKDPHDPQKKEPLFHGDRCCRSNLIRYNKHLHLDPVVTSLDSADWLVISNGRFAVRTDHARLCRLLEQTRADIVAVNVTEQLKAGHERILTAADGRLLGFRRCYTDIVRPAPPHPDWPHHLFIKADALKKLLVNTALPLVFNNLLTTCVQKSLPLAGFFLAGTVYDLDTESGLLAFTAEILNDSKPQHNATKNDSCQQDTNNKIADTAKLFGQVTLGNNVTIAAKAIITGPAIICDNAAIAAGAVIKTSIIGTDVTVPKNLFIDSRVIKAKCRASESLPRPTKNRSRQLLLIENRNKGQNHSVPTWRQWPILSYARCFKRIADLVAASIVLVLFAPVFPAVALAVKLSSRGPVLFTDTRQSLHGKTFECLKFRTMLVGSEKIQQQLRSLNEADGPQFLLTNDPRTSPIGTFLRETHLDEIPQFVNVLLGQMSIVGPRPSPEAENTLCPHWRDARLSVRPGITGLWQICRTREPMKDFQEWIHYDTKYVRQLSPKLDLWICRQTAKKLTQNFVSRF